MIHRFCIGRGTKRPGGPPMEWSWKTITNGTEVADEAAFHEMSLEESCPAYGILLLTNRYIERLFPIRGSQIQKFDWHHLDGNERTKHRHWERQLTCIGIHLLFLPQVRALESFASSPRELLGYWSLLQRKPVTSLQPKKLLTVWGDRV